MLHPRDFYYTLEAIWLNGGDILAKRLPLEQSMIEHGQEDLENLVSYLKHEMARRERELDDMHRIDTIAKEVLEDYGNNLP